MDSVERPINKYGFDGIDPRDDMYNIELFGEVFPSEWAWMSPNEQDERVDEIDAVLGEGKESSDGWDDDCQYRNSFQGIH